MQAGFRRYPIRSSLAGSNNHRGLRPLTLLQIPSCTREGDDPRGRRYSMVGVNWGSRVTIRCCVCLSSESTRRRAAATLRTKAGSCSPFCRMTRGPRGRSTPLRPSKGLRQQLLTGRGIFCPYCSGNPHYKCDSEWREMLSRLSSLALAGRFGPGDWSPLSYRNHRRASM